MPKKVENTIYMWPDGTWRYSSEYSETYDAWKGDDYMVVDIPEDVSYDEVDDWCWQYTKGEF